ncbi:DUF389 domain-containing protein [Cryobacterium roopkundense]|uniref:Putative hydrophobic protein (TIGR00271 family) n=1 Tax=Cryobacterium roopkundense TaxID=1001240 RepID=A0A7W8ZUW4_9MICO|nr:DUF389 domain-containing protein [Cryobacterium roopkundense]MBB5640668.1 putative hydrophobic protein (TIGR00271 family) [Cryobacterium roopkundense]
MALRPARLAMNDLADMRESVFFDGPRARERTTRFWILLVLSSIIAAAGVAADSTATVIGAMIVAPLLLPIQATMLATVLGDRGNLVRSLALVLGGAALAIGIGVLLGLIVPVDVVAESNVQVASRVSPRLIDLLAALATGAVGSIALVRRDISDTLPGVAIAISLVPPLSVVGLTLEAGAFAESLRALLLFVTNVAAILATGIVVMALYGVNGLLSKPATPRERRARLRRGILVSAIMGLVILLPLTVASVTVAQSSSREASVQLVAESWATDAGWELFSVATDRGEVTVRVEGALPLPNTEELERRLRSAGIDPTDVHVDLVPVYSVDF